MRLPGNLVEIADVAWRVFAIGVVWFAAIGSILFCYFKFVWVPS